MAMVISLNTDSSCDKSHSNDFCFYCDVLCLELGKFNMLLHVFTIAKQNLTDKRQLERSTQSKNAFLRHNNSLN